MNDEEFERLLSECRGALSRLVNVKIACRADAEDVIQDACLTAYRARASLKSAENFRAWLIQIGRSRVTDYYRAKGRRREVAMEIPDRGAYTPPPRRDVSDALDALDVPDREIIALYYLRDMTVAEVAARLDVPEGTVKSRLHAARGRFERVYRKREELNMRKLPEIMPEYGIKWTSDAPFSVKCEECMGWFIVPKIGEKLNWAMYDFPARKMTEYVEVKATGRASIHGEEGVEIESVEHIGDEDVRRSFIMQLTDTHSRILSETHMDGGIKRTFTFLDGNDFLDNWGFGEDNCGAETLLVPKGEITRSGSNVTSVRENDIMDIVGRAQVTIGGKMYDTVCHMDIMKYEGHVVTEAFKDESGRTVLWRRFNSDNWQAEKRGGRWSELLPDNERLTVNGKVFVHWYDCLTDYIVK